MAIQHFRWAMALVCSAQVGLGSTAAHASEYCVTCEGPAAMYACAIQGAPADDAVNPRHQLLCITELARTGGHANCSVPRSAPKPCPGTMKLVGAPAAPTDPSDAAEPIPAVEPARQSPVGPNTSEHSKSGATPPVDQAVKPDAPPRTVEEMAKRSLEQSKKNLENAGETVEKAGGSVSEAAKKTWDCLASLFSKC